MIQLLPRPSVTRKTFSLYPAIRPLFGNSHVCSGSGTAFQATWPPCLLLRGSRLNRGKVDIDDPRGRNPPPVADVDRHWLGRPGIAMCGRLSIGKGYLGVRRGWSVLPCVRPVDAAHMCSWP